jgi:hypothetical protein
VPGGLRRRGKTDYFSQQSGDMAAESGDYTDEFVRRGHILAVCEAKYTAEPVE